MPRGFLDTMRVFLLGKAKRVKTFKDEKSIPNRFHDLNGASGVIFVFYQRIVSAHCSFASFGWVWADDFWVSKEEAGRKMLPPP